MLFRSDKVADPPGDTDAALAAKELMVGTLPVVDVPKGHIQELIKIGNNTRQTNASKYLYFMFWIYLLDIQGYLLKQKSIPFCLGFRNWNPLLDFLSFCLQFLQQRIAVVQVGKDALYIVQFFQLFQQLDGGQRIFFRDRHGIFRHNGDFG